MRRKKQYEWPEGTKAGDLVQYYDEGWRYGYLLDVDKQGAKIKPIGGYGANPNAVHVPVSNVEPVEQIKGS